MRLAGLVVVPGDHPAVGSDDAVGDLGCASLLAHPGGRADVSVDRQREDGRHPPYARIAVPNPVMVVSSGCFTRCRAAPTSPADPESSGVEATVRLAKAEIVPTDANLLEEYSRFAQLEPACQAAMERFTGRPHALTRRAPVDMLAEERRIYIRSRPSPTGWRSGSPGPCRGRR